MAEGLSLISVGIGGECLVILGNPGSRRCFKWFSFQRLEGFRHIFPKTESFIFAIRSLTEMWFDNFMCESRKCFLI